jgi:hypothetical protein
MVAFDQAQRDSCARSMRYTLSPAFVVHTKMAHMYPYCTLRRPTVTSTAEAPKQPVALTHRDASSPPCAVILL